MVQAAPKGRVRIVEDVTYMPVMKEMVEEPDMVDTLTLQMTPDGLYKIWPKEKLTRRICGGGVHGRQDEHAGVGFPQVKAAKK